MNIEITKQAFDQLVKHNEKSISDTVKNDHSKSVYKVHGCIVTLLNNHVAGVTQYYIQDINA